MTGSTRAVGYIRCSTDMQEDSPDQQRKEIIAFAERNNIELIDWYQDVGKSGTTFELRPEFQRLKQKVENGRDFDAVICYDESRWGRAIDPLENGYWRHHFQRYGVKLLLVKTSVDPSNEFADVMGAFERAQASQHSKKVSELTLRGSKNNRRYSNGGSASYGYIRVAVNTKTGARRDLAPGEWSIKGQEKVTWGLGDPDEIKVVKAIFTQRSRGDSYMKIALSLNSRRVPAPQRGRWRNEDDLWSPGTIRSIITNHSYYGARVYNKNSMSKIIASQRGRAKPLGTVYPHWMNDPTEWIVEENAHEPIVSRELWARANSITPPRISNGSKPRHHVPYLLTGLLICGRCGSPFQGQSTKSKNKRYYRYVCGGYNKKRICEYCSVNRDVVEGFVLDAVKETLSNPVLMKLIEKKLRALLLARDQSSPGDMKSIERAILIQEQTARNVGEAIGEHGPSPTLMRQLEEAEKEITRLRANKERMEQLRKDKSFVDEVGASVADFLLNFEERIANVPVHEKKDLIRKIVSKIIVDRDENVVRCYVRKIPAVTPEIEDLYEAGDNAKRPGKGRFAPSFVAGTRSTILL